VGNGARTYEAGEILMSSRSERYLSNAEKCRQYADAVDTFGTKRLYEELSRQWLRLAEQAEETGRLTSLSTSAINSSRYMLYNLEREIERFKNSAQPIVASRVAA
jgi:hypothetical protein